jgi:hypothetical protein
VGNVAEGNGHDHSWLASLGRGNSTWKAAFTGVVDPVAALLVVEFEVAKIPEEEVAGTRP